MVVLAWVAALTGTYIIYPWNRAAAALGTTEAFGISTTAAYV
jgi:hypothetical protein